MNSDQSQALRQPLGISLADVARQVRQAFYGEEVQRLQRGPHSLKVMVRYPREERSSIATLEDMHIRTASGQAVAISEVLIFDSALGCLKFLAPTASVRWLSLLTGRPLKSSEQRSYCDIRENFIPQLLKDHPTVEFGVSGSSQDEAELIKRLIVARIASLFLIYGLLAVPLRSYIQPLVIMSVIPFGLYRRSDWPYCFRYGDQLTVDCWFDCAIRGGRKRQSDIGRVCQPSTGNGRLR